VADHDRRDALRAAVSGIRNPLAWSLRLDEPSSAFLDAAVEVCRFLASAADRTPVAARWRGAGSSGLYYGTAGVVVFLTRLAHTAPASEAASLARAGGEALILDLGQCVEAADFGLFTGVCGVALALDRLSTLTDDPRYRMWRDRALDAVCDVPVESVQSNDVISGLAGMGHCLATLGREEFAVRAADELVRRAVPRGPHLAWLPRVGANTEFPNYSHGTAGVADLLWRVGGESHREAAEAGLTYLARISASEGPMSAPHKVPEEPGATRYRGWCHGPVGLATLYSRVGDEEKTRRCVLSTLAPATDWPNLGLCCGGAGLLRFCCWAAARGVDSLCEAKALELGRRLVNLAIRVEGGIAWEFAEHRVRPDELSTQPGLMQGAAGIGVALLDLHDLLSGQYEAAQVFEILQ
jgi:lantibiotic modifying enzyme